MPEAMPQERPNNVYITYKDIVYKLNGHYGSVMWQSPLKRPHEKHWGRDCYLYGMNDLVYAEIGHREIVALRASDGEPTWQWHCPPSVTSALDQEASRYIYRLYIDKSLMYVHSTNARKEGGELAALDLRTGVQQWVQQWDRPLFPPTLLRVSQGILYTRETTTKGVRVLCAFDGATGRERWRFEEAGAALPTDTGSVSDLSPSVVNGIVYDNGNPLYALNAQTGKKLWEQRTFSQDCYFSQLFIHKGTVYADTCEGEAGDYPPEFYCVFAFEAKTGKLLWKSEPGCVLVDVVDEENIVLERVVAKQGEKGQRMILQARATLDRMLRWQVTVVQRSSIHYPVQVHIAEKKLYVLDNGQPGALQVFDVGSGKQLGRYVLSLPPNEFIQKSWLSDGMLYIHSCEPFSFGRDWLNAICAIRLADGSTIWRYEIGPLKSHLEPISEVLLAP